MTVRWLEACVERTASDGGGIPAPFGRLRPLGIANPGEVL